MKPFYYIILCFFSLSAFAQQVSISPPQQFNIKKETAEILGNFNGHTLLFLGGKNDNKLQVYNADLAMTKQKYLELPRKAIVEKAILIDSTITVFVREKEKKKLILSAHQYSLGLMADTNVVYLDTVTKGFTEPYEDFYFLQSEDKSKVLLYYFENNNSRSGELQYILLDKEMHFLGKGSVSLPMKNYQTFIYDILLANNGNFFAVLVEYEDITLSTFKSFYVLSSARDFQVFDHFTLSSTEDYFLNNTYFKYDNVHQEIKAAGFYVTARNMADAAEGIFFKTFAKNTTISDSIYLQAFEPEFIARTKGSKRIRENDRLFSFMIEDMILRSDGGALLIAESIYQTSRNGDIAISPYGYAQSTDISVVYHYDEVLMVSMGPKGEVDWKEVMPKTQVAIGDLRRYCSYALLNTGSRLIFLYNDQIDDRANVIHYQIDAGGEYNRNILLNSYKNDLFLLPEEALQVSATEIIIPSYKQRKLRLVKVDY